MQEKDEAQEGGGRKGGRGELHTVPLGCSDDLADSTSSLPLVSSNRTRFRGAILSYFGPSISVRLHPFSRGILPHEVELGSAWVERSYSAVVLWLCDTVKDVGGPKTSLSSVLRDELAPIRLVALSSNPYPALRNP